MRYQEEAQRLTNETTEAIMMILQHCDIFPLWRGIMEEVSRGMEEYQESCDNRLKEQKLVDMAYGDYRP